MTQIHWLNPVSADFKTPADWSTETVPGANDDAVLDAAGSTPYTVTVSKSRTVNGIDLAANASLDISGALTDFTLINGTDGGVNAGTILVEAETTLTASGLFDNAGSVIVHHYLEIGAAGATFSGGGTVALYGDIGGLGGVGRYTLTNIDNTILGGGFIGSGTPTPFVLINEAGGVIDAINSNSALILGSDSITNAGLLEGTGRAGLDISGCRVEGRGGLILAGAGSRVVVSGSTVDGGRLATAAGGQIQINNYSSVTGSGVFVNAGTISMGGVSQLMLSANTTLRGGGTVSSIASGQDASITGTKAGVVLTNVNNTIVGDGMLLGGEMTLVNDAAGHIDATGPLTIDTGANAIVNAGLIEATSRGVCVIDSAVANSGVLRTVGGTLTLNGTVTGSGSATIATGTLDFTSGFNQDVAFTRKTGKLELAQSQAYTASISSFSHTGGTSLDLRDIGFVSSGETTYSGTATSGVLTVTDGTHTAHINLVGNFTGATFIASSDGLGGTIVVDPPGGAPVHRFVAAMAGTSAGGAGALHASPEPWRAPAALLAGPRVAIA